MNRSYVQFAYYLLRHGSLVKATRDKLLWPNLYSDWPNRLRLARACPDNTHIHREPGAGTVNGGWLAMHSGVKVHADSYYGEGNTKLLMANEGVHEPQEEYVFQEVLKHLSTGATMLELGAYWGFYSLWFALAVPEGRAFLVEPEAPNLQSGIQNFELNGRHADFTQALVGEVSDPTSVPPLICVDDLVTAKKIDHLTILHSDIQGHEMKMLRGSQQLFRDRKVDYVFISTHGFWLHLECLDFLKSKDFVILASSDKFESYSLDGLICARRREISGCPPIKISIR